MALNQYQCIEVSKFPRPHIVHAELLGYLMEFSHQYIFIRAFSDVKCEKVCCVVYASGRLNLESEPCGPVSNSPV